MLQACGAGQMFAPSIHLTIYLLGQDGVGGGEERFFGRSELVQNVACLSALFQRVTCFILNRNVKISVVGGSLSQLAGGLPILSGG